MTKKRKKQLNSVKAKHAFWREIRLYTLGWGIAAGFLILFFVIGKRSFLWHPDGIYQHFTAFGRTADALRTIFVYHKWPASFDFTLGQGADLLTTLNSYDLMDPVSILAASLAFLSRPVRYTLMVFLKLYLTGFSFIIFCRATDSVKTDLTAAAAITYTFSNAILYTGLQHPNFINWGYFFPLLLAGVELYRRQQKKLPLLLTVFCNVVTNYYTFYINSVLVVLYVIVSVLDETVGSSQKGKTFLHELTESLKVAGIYAAGIALSAFTLLPTAYVYLNNPRVAEANGYTASILHYPMQFYTLLTENAFSAGYSMNDTVLGLSALAAVGIFAVIFRRGNRKWAALLLISFCMLLIPLAGRILNGFSYASNRWAFCIPFFAAYALVLTGDTFPEWGSSAKMGFYLLIATYVTGCLMHTKTNQQPTKYLPLIMLIYVSCVIGIAAHYRFRHFGSLYFALAVVCAVFMIYASYSVRDERSSFVNAEEVMPTFEDTSISMAKKIGNDSFFRVETQEVMANLEGWHDLNGTSVWYSMLPAYYLEYYQELGLVDATQNCNFRGLDGRPGLLELAGVRYYTKKANKKTQAPYGYERQADYSNEAFSVWENAYTLPIGYTYTGFIPEKNFKELTAIQKEEALLQCAVLSGVDESDDLIMEGFGLAEYPLNYEFLDATDAELGKNEITALKKEGNIRFTADIPDDCEIYLYFKNPEISGSTVASITFMARRDTKKFVIAKRGVLTGNTYKWTFDREDLAIDLGHGNPGENTITLTMLDTGAFTYDEMQLIAVPLSLYRESAAARSEYALENAVVTRNHVTGSIRVPEQRILQFAIPYSDGWKVYIDGEETPVIRSDIMYMSVIVPEGEHAVSLVYRTPFAKAGMIISCVTAAMIAVYGLVTVYLEKKRAEKDIRKA